jgi:sulfopyruvate decarboxylase subunit beta
VADLDRADVLRFIDAAAPDSPVVLSLGGIAREMLAVAGRKGNHFISLDAMGQTVPVALGLALGLERHAGVGKVIAIEGDG